MNNFHFFLSIIIPHHNIPKLLDRCLNSIPCRDDLEIIVVDDCSDDETKKEIFCLERKYTYVKFIYHSVCSGAGKARNLGISSARGKYVMFADSDDFFNYCLSDVLNQYSNLDFDLIYFNANSLDTDTFLLTDRCAHLNWMHQVYDLDKSRGLFYLRYIFGEPWSKMIKRSVITNNNILFDETIIHNDTKFSYLVGHYSNNVKVDHRAIYCVTDRRGSVSKQVSQDRLLVRTKVFSEANTFFEANAISYFEEKALRPMMMYLCKFDFENYRKCKSIVKQYGLTGWRLFVKHLVFPIYVFKKFWLKRQFRKSLL